MGFTRRGGHSRGRGNYGHGHGAGGQGHPRRRWRDQHHRHALPGLAKRRQHRGRHARPRRGDGRGLRERQAVSTALPSLTVFEGTLGAVATVEGVTRWRGYENDTNVEDDNGLPPHSICLVVEGGDAQSIADAIAVKKTPSCYTHGDVEVLTRDEMGVPNHIRFITPRPCACACA